METAKQMARAGRLPISKVASNCSEGRERRKIVKHFDFDQKSVVEVGCGRGYYTQFLAQEATKVVALDKMLAGRETHMWDNFRKILEGHGVWQKVVPIEADARNIPLPSDSFDIGTSAGGFFRDLYPSGTQREVLSELKRVCEHLMIGMYVKYKLSNAQQNYLQQLQLRKEALQAVGCSEENQIHLPVSPQTVRTWFRDIGIHRSRILHLDLPCSWAADVSSWVERVKEPDKRKIFKDRLKSVQTRIKNHGCTRPPVMLVWA